jgi:hypothetical protein
LRELRTANGDTAEVGSGRGSGPATRWPPHAFAPPPPQLRRLVRRRPQRPPAAAPRVSTGSVCMKRSVDSADRKSASDLLIIFAAPCPRSSIDKMPSWAAYHLTETIGTTGDGGLLSSGGRASAFFCSRMRAVSAMIPFMSAASARTAPSCSVAAARRASSRVCFSAACVHRSQNLLELPV